MYSLSWNLLDIQILKGIPLQLQGSISLIGKSNHGAMVYTPQYQLLRKLSRQEDQEIMVTPGSISETSYQI